MPQHHRITFVSLIATYDLLDGPILIKVAYIHPYRPDRRGLEPRVEPVIAEDKVDITITVEIRRNNTIPPTLPFSQTRLLSTVHQLPTLVDKHGYGHVFAHHQQIIITIPIDVSPHRIRNHTDVRQIRRCLATYIRKVSPSVVL